MTRQGELFAPTGPRPLRIMAGGHDVTASMPLTRARLEAMRDDTLQDLSGRHNDAGTNDTPTPATGCHIQPGEGLGCHSLRPQPMTPYRSIGRHSADRTNDAPKVAP